MIWLGLAWAADCPAPVLEDALDETLTDALEQYKNVDIDGFRGSVEKANAQLACLGQPLDRSVAAAYHRVRGLAFFVQRENALAASAFAAARTIEPAYVFPSTVIPSGNPALAQYAAIDLSELEVAALAEPLEGRVRVNGGRAERTGDLPVIVQQFAKDGSVRDTWWVGQGESVPYATTADKPARKGGGGRLAVTANAVFYDGLARTSPPLMGGFSVLAAVPAGPVAVDVGGHIGYFSDTSFATDGSDELFWTPVFRAGVRVPVEVDGVDAYVGAVGLAAFHGDEAAAGVTGGGAAIVGVEVELNSRFYATIDAMGGFNDGLVGTLGGGTGIRF